MKKILFLFFLVVFLIRPQNSIATNVVIIESASMGHSMDVRWLGVCTGLGYNAAIYPQTKLDSTNWFNTTDVLIVSSGVIPLTVTGVSTIQAFLLQGGRVFLQTEYLTSFGANQAFQQIVNACGGSFTWLGTTAGTLAPMNVLGSLAVTPDTIPPLTYFWYGDYALPGCNSHIESFLEYQGQYFGFIFCVPSNNSRMITTSDQDWVQSSTSIPLMNNIAINLAAATYSCTYTPGSLSVNLGADKAICNGQPVTLSAAGSGGTTYLWSTGDTTGSISTNTTGTYWVRVSGGSCTGSDTVVVFNGNALSITAGPDTSVCAGAALQLSASFISGATYTWTGPQNFNTQNPLIPVTTYGDSGTYTVVASIGSCSSPPVTTHVTVTTLAAPAVMNNGPICVGDTLRLNASFSAGATYSWTGPQSFNTQNPVIPGASIADSGTYILIAYIGTCSSPPVTTQVAINPAPVISAVANNGPLCIGDTLKLNASFIPGVTYSWTGPQSFNVQNPVVPISAFSDSGTYTVIASIGTCSSPPVTTRVAINPAPVISAATNNGPLCAGDTLKLNASFIPGVTYSWTGPQGFNVQNPVVPISTLPDSGTYNVIASIGTCTSAPVTTHVVINPAPAQPVLTNNGPLCVGDTLKLNASLIPGASYTWTGPQNFNTQNPVILATTSADSGTYTAIVSLGGCNSLPASTYVVIHFVPAQPVITNNGPLCVGDTLKLTAASNAGASYIWTGPHSFNIQNPVISSAAYADSGVYTVVASLGNCSSVPATTFVVIKPAPAAPVASNNSPICAGDTLRLNASFTAGASYSWTGPHNFSQQNPVILNATTSDSGTYTVVLTIGTCSSNPVSTIAVVHPSPAPPVITASDTVICASDSAQLCVPAIFSTYTWNTGAGTPCVYIRSAGNYNATVSDANGCVAQSNHISLAVKPVPSASISIDGDTLTCHTPGTYQWYLNGNVIPGATSSIYIAHQPGAYTIQITGSDGCASVSSDIVIAAEGIATVRDRIGFKVYPSPVSDQLIVEFCNNGSATLQVEIFDAIGQRVSQLNMEGPKAEINVSTFATGVYFVKIGDRVRRFLKE